MNIASIVSLTVVISALTASAATFAVNPTADAFVSTGSAGGLSGNNYGGGGAIGVSAAGLPQGQLQTVLQFDVAPAVSSFNATYGAGQWTLQSISLQLTATAPNNAIFNASAAGLLGVSWMANDSWQEGAGSPNAPGASGITFDNLQNTFLSGADESPGSTAFSGATSGAVTIALGLTPGFSSDVLAGGNVSLRVFAADASVSGVFNSRSFATIANRPLLTIVAVPEPAVPAFGAVAIAVVAIRRSRKPAKDSFPNSVT